MTAEECGGKGDLILIIQFFTLLRTLNSSSVARDETSVAHPSRRQRRSSLNFFWSQSRAFWLWLFLLEPEPNFLALIFFGGSQSQSFLALIIFFGARAELFGSDYFFLEPEPNFLALLIFFLEPEPNFLALIIFFWSQSRAFWLWIFILEPVTELEVLGAY